MSALWSRLQKVSPVWLTLFASVLLSLIAISGEATVGKDAAFYLDVAKDASEHGWVAAQERFNWPWFALLLAWSHAVTGFSLEFLAYGWCVLFMAGTCALLVDSVRREAPQAVWWAVLVVLSMPAFNQFRSDILREFGFWFFIALSLWLALSWRAEGGWLRLLALLLALVCAALFRLEALFVVGALALWQLPGLFRADARSRALQLYSLLLGLAATGSLALLLLVKLYDFPTWRLVYYAMLLSPERLFASFNTFAANVADSMMYKFSRDDAGQILFFGIVVNLAYQVLKLFGPYALLLLNKGSWINMTGALRQFSLFGWSALLYFFVLLLFFVQEQFTTSRYVSLMNWLLMPVAALLAYQFAQRCPRLGKVLVAIALLVMLANVVSTGAKKTHYVEAGHWLKEHVSADANIYYDDLRVSYYAGFGYPLEKAVSLNTAWEAPQEYDYLLIEAGGDEPELLAWLAEHQLKVLASFANRRDARILVIGR